MDGQGAHFKSAIKAMKDAGMVRKIKDFLSTEKIIDKEKLQKINGFGVILRALNSGYKDNESIEDARITKELNQKKQLLNLLIFIMTSVGTLLCLYSYHMEFNDQIGWKNHAFLYINMAITFLCCLFVYLRETIHLNLLKYRGLVDSKDSLITSGKHYKVIQKWVILMIHPYPFLLGYKFKMLNTVTDHVIHYNINDIFQLLSLLRLVFILNSLMVITQWKTSSAQRICSMYGCKADTLFALRASMKNYPFLFLMAFLSVSIIIFGQAIRICEAPLIRVDEKMTKEMDHSNFINCVWLVIVTMTTVGYGDIYPRTYMGRAIMFICSIFGVVIVSLTVATIRNHLDMTPYEAQAYTVINKIRMKNKMRHEAATIISKASRLYLQIKKNNPVHTKKFYELNTLVSEFKESRRIYKNQKNYNQTDEIFREFENIKNTTKEIIMYMSVLAKMVTAGNIQTVKGLEDEGDKRIACVLIGAQDGADLKLLKDQSILKEYRKHNDIYHPEGDSDYISITESNISGFRRGRQIRKSRINNNDSILNIKTPRMASSRRPSSGMINLTPKATEKLIKLYKMEEGTIIKEEDHDILSVCDSNIPVVGNGSMYGMEKRIAPSPIIQLRKIADDDKIGVRMKVPSMKKISNHNQQGGLDGEPIIKVNKPPSIAKTAINLPTKGFYEDSNNKTAKDMTKLHLNLDGPRNNTPLSLSKLNSSRAADLDSSCLQDSLKVKIPKTIVRTHMMSNPLQNYHDSKMTGGNLLTTPNENGAIHETSIVNSHREDVPNNVGAEKGGLTATKSKGFLYSFRSKRSNSMESQSRSDMGGKSPILKARSSNKIALSKKNKKSNKIIINTANGNNNIININFNGAESRPEMLLSQDKDNPSGKYVRASGVLKNTPIQKELTFQGSAHNSSLGDSFRERGNGGSKNPSSARNNGLRPKRTSKCNINNLKKGRQKKSGFASSRPEDTPNIKRKHSSMDDMDAEEDSEQEDQQEFIRGEYFKGNYQYENSPKKKGSTTHSAPLHQKILSFFRSGSSLGDNKRVFDEESKSGGIIESNMKDGKGGRGAKKKHDPDKYKGSTGTGDDMTRNRLTFSEQKKTSAFGGEQGKGKLKEKGKILKGSARKRR